MFFTVVEMFKLSLVQSLQFISRHLPSAKWSLVYSNVDNLILILEEAHSLDDAIRRQHIENPATYAQYLQEKKLHCGSQSTRGGSQTGHVKIGVVMLHFLVEIYLSWPSALHFESGRWLQQWLDYRAPKLSITPTASCLVQNLPSPFPRSGASTNFNQWQPELLI